MYSVQVRESFLHARLINVTCLPNVRTDGAVITGALFFRQVILFDFFFFFPILVDQKVCRWKVGTRFRTRLQLL